MIKDMNLSLQIASKNMIKILEPTRPKKPRGEAMREHDSEAEKQMSLLVS
jgi:hypothetical protein